MGQRKNLIAKIYRSYGKTQFKYNTDKSRRYANLVGRYF